MHVLSINHFSTDCKLRQDKPVGTIFFLYIFLLKQPLGRVLFSSALQSDSYQKGLKSEHSVAQLDEFNSKLRLRSGTASFLTVYLL